MAPGSLTASAPNAACDGVATLDAPARKAKAHAKTQQSEPWPGKSKKRASKSKKPQARKPRHLDPGSA